MNMRPIFVLVSREWTRYIRQKSRVLSTLLTPLLFWALLGFGFGESFQTSEYDRGYQVYFLPGALLMVLLFSAIFSMISLIEDRNEGFLQSVMVSPVSHLAVVIGKILGGSVLAVFQTLFLLPLIPIVGFSIGLGTFFALIGLFLLISIFLCSLSFLVAWIVNSSHGFHAFMNILLFPMWFLSGAMFPVETSSPIIQWVMMLNPMTYALKVVRATIDLGFTALLSSDMVLNISIVFSSGLLLGFASIYFVKKSYQ